MMVHALYKDNQYWIYAGLPTIIANGRRYGKCGNKLLLNSLPAQM
jgi:hypothetical protein